MAMHSMKTNLREDDVESDGSAFDATVNVEAVEVPAVEVAEDPEMVELAALVAARQGETDAALAAYIKRPEGHDAAVSENAGAEVSAVDGDNGSVADDAVGETAPTAEIPAPAGAQKVDLDRSKEEAALRKLMQQPQGGGGGGGAIGSIIGGIGNVASSLIYGPTNVARGGARTLSNAMRERIFDHYNKSFVTNFESFKKAGAASAAQINEFNAAFAETTAGHALTKIAEGNRSTLGEYLKGMNEGKIVDPVASSLRDAALQTPELASKWQAIEETAKTLSLTGTNAARNLGKLDKNFADRFDSDKAAGQLNTAAQELADNTPDALGGEAQKKLVEQMKEMVESIKATMAALVEKVINAFKR